jgi:hypothetical protein
MEDLNIYKTTREITFGYTGSDKKRTKQQTVPAGTEVYVYKTDKENLFKLRVRGSLLTQFVCAYSFEFVRTEQA